MNKIKGLIAVMIMAGSLIAIPALAVNDGNNGNPNPGMGRGNGRPEGIARAQQGEEAKQPGANANAGANVCDRINDMSSQISQRFDEKKTPEDRLANWQQKTSEQDAKLTQLRTSWDNNRDAQFSKLEEGATTDEQKKAVADFEAMVKAAITARRTAVDTALQNFRNGVKGLIAAKAQAVSSGATAFSDAVKTAFDKAKSDCRSGVDPKTIRTTLKSSLQAAKAKFQSDRQAAPKVGGNIQALITARKQAMDKAMVDFKVAMEKARADLKKAFPDDNSTVKNPETPAPISATPGTAASGTNQ